MSTTAKKTQPKNSSNKRKLTLEEETVLGYILDIIESSFPMENRLSFLKKDPTQSKEAQKGYALLYNKMKAEIKERLLGEDIEFIYAMCMFYKDTTTFGVPKGIIPFFESKKDVIEEFRITLADTDQQEMHFTKSGHIIYLKPRYLLCPFSLKYSKLAIDIEDYFKYRYCPGKDIELLQLNTKVNSNKELQKKQDIKIPDSQSLAYKLADLD